MRRLRHMSVSSKPRNIGKWPEVVAVVTVVVFALATKKENLYASEPHFSTREGRIIRMQPSGAHFQIPQDWEGLYIERNELREVRKGKGEWNTEYTTVVNAALPFSDCSVQAGRWSSDSAAGVTVRGYVLSRSAADVQNRIATKAMRAAKELPSQFIRNVSATKEELAGWHRVLIAYDVWYYDYGGRANIDFYTTEKNGSTIALVFMYRSPSNWNGQMPLDPEALKESATVKQVLQSFSW